MNPQKARGPASQTHDWPALIVKAQANVYPTAAVTPLTRAPRLSAALGHTVTLKREDQQPVFSFKLRGALNKLAALSETELARGVICSSAGNHAQGVSLAARQREVRAVIVMPVTTPAIKISAVAALGGEVVLHGDTYDDAQAEAHARAQHEGLPA
ncbi:MAG: pyridoxal-phosphate dependent enzyme, partial [Pseudomonadota bacterium]